MMIVVELSNQVSEQNEKIEKLEKELQSKERIIQELMSKVPKKHVVASKKSLKLEKKQDEENTLKKLSLGLNGYTVPPSREGSRHNHGDDSRFSSGASRDSGLGYVDKSSVNQVVSGAQKSSSDSDWNSDDEPSFTSKIRSAPVDQQLRHINSRTSSISAMSPFPYAEEDRSLDDNCSISSSTRNSKSKKQSYLQKRFKTSNEQAVKSPMPVNLNAFEKEASFDDSFAGSAREVKSKNHFFLTQPDAVSTDTVTNG